MDNDFWAHCSTIWKHCFGIVRGSGSHCPCRLAFICRVRSHEPDAPPWSPSASLTFGRSRILGRCLSPSGRLRDRGNLIIMCGAPGGRAFVETHSSASAGNNTASAARSSVAPTNRTCASAGTHTRTQTRAPLPALHLAPVAANAAARTRRAARDPPRARQRSPNISQTNTIAKIFLKS